MGRNKQNFKLISVPVNGNSILHTCTADEPSFRPLSSLRRFGAGCTTKNRLNNATEQRKNEPRYGQWVRPERGDTGSSASSFDGGDG